MSPQFSETIEIDAPPERVWEVVMDPARLGDWVSAHREISDVPETPLKPGEGFSQTLSVGGKSFKVRWKLVEAKTGELAVWEAEGPKGTHADVRYELSECEAGGTCFDYVNDFSLPGGPLKAVAGSISGPPAKVAARKSLKDLKRLLERG